MRNSLGATRTICLTLGLVLTASAAADKAYDAHVRRVVADLQGTEVIRREPEGALANLDARAVPELIRLIPRIERREALHAVGMQLLHLHALKSIQAMIDTFPRNYPGTSTSQDQPARDVLWKWGWEADGLLIKGVESPNPRIRFYCAQMISSQCALAGAYDKRIMRALVRLLKTGEPPMQRIAVEGLMSAAVHFRTYWDGSRGGPAEIRNPNAFREIVEASLDAPVAVKALIVASLWEFLGTHGAPAMLKRTEPIDGQLVANYEATMQALCKSKESAVRMAVLALLHLETWANPLSISALADKAADVRQVAVKALAGKMNQELLAAVAEHARSSRPEVRVAAAKALGLSYRRNALKYLVPLLADPQPGVRAAAKDAVRRISGETLSAM